MDTCRVVHREQPEPHREKGSAWPARDATDRGYYYENGQGCDRNGIGPCERRSIGSHVQLVEPAVQRELVREVGDRLRRAR